jgi:hypothetical protein
MSSQALLFPASYHNFAAARKPVKNSPVAFLPDIPPS